MAVEQGTSSESVLAAREQYVPRGIATPPIVVARAEGARVEDVDGRKYIDFAGGLGCQNTGHGFPPAVAAMHQQIDTYLHQCLMVGIYEPYVEVCRRLAELSPCVGGNQKSLLLNSGAEAVENAVKIARAATGKPGVVVFENAFHGRTLLTMTMTHKETYKQGFGPFAPEVYRAPGPYPYRGVSSDDSLEAVATLLGLHDVACVVLEPVQGEGGFIEMPGDFPARLKELCAEHGALYVDDEVQSGVGRTGPVWAIEHYEVEPDLLVSGKSLGGGLPLAAVTGRAEVMDAPEPGGLGGTFGGNPVACAAALAVLDEVATESFRSRSIELGAHIRTRLDEIAARIEQVGEVRGLGPMLAMELVTDRDTKEPAADLAKRTTEAARERGLILLSCGTYGNVIRILVPLVIADEDLDRGLEILEEALVHAAAS
jgi:4-aminobutyrate aminotransferase / (S)-3-amino-2-methylpropionate transaminase / 5-aminovalerate transaminase